MNRHDLRKIAAELKRRGGVKPLMRQFDLNVDMENRFHELETGVDGVRRTRKSLEDGMAKRLEDDRLEQEKHEQHLGRIHEEHIRFVNENRAEGAKIVTENVQFRKENASLREENLGLKEQNGLSRWIVGFARRDKEAIEALAAYNRSKDYQCEPPSAITDYMFERLMQLARDDLTNRGLLVPVRELYKVKEEVVVAKRQSFLDRLVVKMILALFVTFVKDPMKMTIDQRRLLLWIYGQIANHVQPGPSEVVRIIQNSERCPVHRVTMGFDFQRAQWVCPVLSCTFRG